MKPHYHVAVGVVHDKKGRVLLSQRPPGKDQAGKWEFAGGKLEPGESVQEALIREFEEELGIKPTRFSHLISISHEYPQYSVLLDTWQIHDFEGEPQSLEGQLFRWIFPLELKHYDFPEANQAIIQALLWPAYYSITSDQPMKLEDFSQRLQQSFEQGIKLCRVRQGTLSSQDYQDRIETALAIKPCGVNILVDGPPTDRWPQVAGWHLNSTDLYHYHPNNLASDKILMASLHTLNDILQANKLGVHASVLSPVKMTPSHPHAQPLGWEKFAELAAQANHPVYALGGLTQADLACARKHGAPGIAGVRGIF